jgi:hypothetical protein
VEAQRESHYRFEGEIVVEHRLKTKFYGITKGEYGLLSDSKGLMIISPVKSDIQRICNWLNIYRSEKHEVVKVYCVIGDE